LFTTVTFEPGVTVSFDGVNLKSETVMVALPPVDGDDDADGADGEDAVFEADGVEEDDGEPPPPPEQPASAVSSTSDAPRVRAGRVSSSMISPSRGQ